MYLSRMVKLINVNGCRLAAILIEACLIFFNSGSPFETLTQNTARQNHAADCRFTGYRAICVITDF